MKFRFVGLLLLASCMTKASSERSDDGSVPRIGLYFKQTEGQVGNHFSTPIWGEWDSVGERIEWTLQSLSIQSGTLPPGLSFQNEILSGTPTQAGEWYVRFDYTLTARRGGQSETQNGVFAANFTIRGGGKDALYCGFCGDKQKSGWFMCSGCGSTKDMKGMTAKYCGYCGARNQGNWTQCSSCGAAPTMGK